MSEWTSKKEQEVVDEAVRKFNSEQKDPHFLVLGATGVGKSSLINRVFRADLNAVNDVKSTTRSFRTHEYKASGNNTILITDSPGYGEIRHDEEYSGQVVTESRKAHVMILVLKADEKGYQRDINILTGVFGSPEFDQHQPFLIALNQIDKLPPIREWTPPYDLHGQPTDADGDKAKHIKQKIALVRDQFGTIAGRGVLPDICPTMSEPREGDVFGIEAFREQLFDCLPKVAKLKYARASRIAENASRELLEKLDSYANGIIGSNAAAAATAVALNPLPVSDWAILAPLQISMIVELGAVYGKTIDAQSAKETLLALGAGFAARTIFQGIISLFPGIKNIVGPPYAAAATHGMGVAAKAYFKTGKVPTKDVIEKAMNEELRRRQGN